jgi:hypothetical protein
VGFHGSLFDVHHRSLAGLGHASATGSPLTSACQLLLYFSRMRSATQAVLGGECDPGPAPYTHLGICRCAARKAGIFPPRATTRESRTHPSSAERAAYRHTNRRLRRWDDKWGVRLFRPFRVWANAATLFPGRCPIVPLKYKISSPMVTLPRAIRTSKRFCGPSPSAGS